MQAAMQEEVGTQMTESSEVEMPDVETEESPLFALNIAIKQDPAPGRLRGGSRKPGAP
jgi:hypothetical protein